MIGAHYDHLGRGEFGSLAPDRRGEIHNGADDNASGAAGLLELARAFAAAAASAPQPRAGGLLRRGGRAWSARASTWPIRRVPLANTVAMVNLDMIGRLRSGTLFIFGTETSPDFPEARAARRRCRRAWA